MDIPLNGAPESWFTPRQLELIDNSVRHQNELGYGIHRQDVMNLLMREAGATRRDGSVFLDSNAGPQLGVGQFTRGTWNALGFGGDPLNVETAIPATVEHMVRVGTGGSAERVGRLPFDNERAIVGHQTGPGGVRAWEQAGRDYEVLRRFAPGHDPVAYMQNVQNGTLWRMHEQAGNRWNAQEEQNWRLNDEALGFLGPGGQVRTDEAWGVNPVGDFYRMQLGPSGTLGQEMPWNIPGIINPEYGHYLQTQGLMPANLLPNAGTDLTNTTWTAPAGSQPGWWGPWGAEQVHNWAQEGVSHGYGAPVMSLLGNLNYNLVDPGIAPGPGNAPLGGQAQVATGGVDLAHWIAQQWGQGWGQRGVDPGVNVWDATPTQVWDAHPDLTFWDASANPLNPVWRPAGGGWGEAGPGGVNWTAGQAELQAAGNPNNWIWNPATTSWGTFAGGIGEPLLDYNRWYEDVMAGISPVPEGGYNPTTGLAPLPQGLGYEGASGLTQLPPGRDPYQAMVEYNNWASTMSGAASLGPVAAHGGPVIYGFPGLGQGPTYPATQGPNVFTVGNTTFNPVTGQTINPWNPLGGINPLTGVPNSMMAQPGSSATAGPLKPEDQSADQFRLFDPNQQQQQQQQLQQQMLMQQKKQPQPFSLFGG